MNKIILIAEDYDDARGFMKFFLESGGYEVHTAVNGEEAVRMTKEYHPGLILMDIAMPVMDGLTAVRIIRKSDIGISKIPIIALTAFNEDHYKEALEGGCHKVLSKPVNLDELEAVINKYRSYLGVWKIIGLPSKILISASKTFILCFLTVEINP